jgi:hypothetical protein
MVGLVPTIQPSAGSNPDERWILRDKPEDDA